jgi:lysophospholipase L1-like esterase
VHVVVVHQREPHAGQLGFMDVEQPTTFAARAQLARRTLTDNGLDVDVWIDGLDDASRFAFGALPNWAIVVDPAGVVRLKLPWFVPEVVDRAVDEVEWEFRAPRPPGEAKPAAAVDRTTTFLAALAAPAPAAADEVARQRDAHHRDAMRAHLVGALPGHAERDRWLAELARATAPEQQRQWAMRQPPTVPAGEDPQRWAAEVQQFVDADRANPPPPGGVVFVGSSSIRGWRSLADDMPGLPVVRRGVGGSRLFDACYWSDELVNRHRPAAVVLFSGTNDLAGDRPKTAERVRDLFLLFVQRVRRDDPELPIAWIAITPSPARAQHIGLVRAANELVRAECAADPRLSFIDPTPDLALPDGAPDPRFFQRDGLHLNADGYAVWTRHVRPVAERLRALR